MGEIKEGPIFVLIRRTRRKEMLPPQDLAWLAVNDLQFTSLVVDNNYSSKQELFMAKKFLETFPG